MLGGRLGTARGAFRSAAGRGRATACLSNVGPSHAAPGRRTVTGTASVATGGNGLTGKETQKSCHRGSPHRRIKAPDMGQRKPVGRRPARSPYGRQIALRRGAAIGSSRPRGQLENSPP
jgi:hypothetical protein